VSFLHAPMSPWLRFGLVAESLNAPTVSPTTLSRKSRSIWSNMARAFRLRAPHRTLSDSAADSPFRRLMERLQSNLTYLSAMADIFLKKDEVRLAISMQQDLGTSC
jgi:phage gp16-like protein